MSQENVTIRYASNLLRDGTNGTYDLVTVSQEPNIVEGQHIGHYFKVVVACGPAGDFSSHFGLAATPLTACRRALERHGVTFR